MPITATGGMTFTGGASTMSAPALSLDFMSQSLVSFSRGTQATLVDSTGTITYAPNNLFTYSEFPNGVTDAPVRGGLITATTFAGLNSNTGIAFGYDGVTASYAYKGGSSNGITYILSVYVRMDDGGAPSFKANSAFDVTNDFVIVVGGNVSTPLGYVVSDLGGGLYRVSSRTTAGSVNNNGVNKYSSNSNRTFKVSGYQLEAVTYQTTPSTYNFTASSAYYGPRYDYNPATLQPNGLLIEQQSTNLFLQSNFSSSWSFSANTSFTGSVSAPDGTVSGKTLNDTSSTVNGYVYQGVSVTSGTTYNVSIYVKRGTLRYFMIKSFTQPGTAVFDLSTNTINTRDGIVIAATITSAGNGWYRCTATMVANATASNNIGFGDYELTNTGDLCSVWGAQLEASYSASSYIPTVASTVTRNADNAVTSGSLDSRISFSRGTNATLVDSTGKLTYAPNNLMTYSEQFDNAAWVKTSSGLGTAPVVTGNYGTAPDGTSTADRLQMNLNGGTTTSDWSSMYQGTTLVTGVNYFYSVWLRSNDSNNYVLLARDDTGSSGVSALWTVTPTWQRFSYVATATTTNSSSGLRLWLRGSLGTSNTADVLVWGAQLEAVTYQTTPNTYQSTTTKNLIGYSEAFENASWTKTQSFVQTNLFTYSEQFDNAAWTASNVTVSPNAATSPIGQQTADIVVPNTTNILHYVGNASLALTGSYTVSIYVKAAGYTSFGMARASDSSAVSFDIASGTITSTGAAWSSPSITYIGNNWYRCTGVVSLTSDWVYFSPNTASAAFAGDGTSGVYIWGAQIVQGAVAGDYQVTGASSAAIQYTAPNGYLTAEKLVEDTTASAQHYTAPSSSLTLSDNGIYTQSIYAKAGERSVLTFSCRRKDSTFAVATFNLSTGVVSGASNVISSGMTSVGNGWYRCYTTFNVLTGAGLSFPTYLLNNGSGTVYTGDGTSGLYLWGAQLSDSASLDTYVYNPAAAPTSTAYYGPRFDFNPVTLQPNGLLVEPQRTNLLTYSEQFDNAAWVKGSSSVTANSILSPDGTTTADKIIVTNGTTLGQSTAAGVKQNLTKAASAITYTLTVYAKAAEFNSVILFIANNAASASARCTFNLSAGTASAVTIFGTFVAVSSTITSAGNGWYRCVLTATSDTDTTLRADFWPFDTIATTGNGTSGIYVWGAQLEAASFATSYIPTVASTATRNADTPNVIGSNLTSWYNQNQGAFTFRVIPKGIPAAGANMRFLEVNDGTGNNRNPLIYAASSGISFTQYRVATVDQANLQGPANSFAVNTTSYIGTTYNINDFASVWNGANLQTDLSGLVVTGATQMNIGWAVSATGEVFSGYVQSLEYYNYRVPNAQLQGLTKI